MVRNDKGNLRSLESQMKALKKKADRMQESIDEFKEYLREKGLEEK